MARDDFKYMGIYNHFRGSIESGDLLVGAKLPTEDQIIKQFGVSRITVVRGLERLQQDSYITRVQGSGSFVRSRLASNTGIKVVSFITSFTGEGREGQLISGLEGRLKESGYLLSVSNSSENRETERELIYSIKDKIQGIVLYASSSVDNIDLFESLLMDNYPIVFLDRHPMSLPCSSISCDNFDGGKKIGGFFVENGHKRIAFMYHNLTGLSSERDRYNGFMQAMSEGNIPRKDISTFSVKGHDTPEAVGRIMGELYGRKDGSPTAIFAVNDHLAMAVRQYLKKHQDHTLQDVLLAGFDDLIGDRLDSPFVTIRQEYARMGRKAAALLIDKIENHAYMPENHVMPIEFVTYNV